MNSPRQPLALLVELKHGAYAFAAVMALLLSGCVVGPKYHSPVLPVPPQYKENSNWRMAQPNDQALRGNWWEIFQDPRLNGLEEQINSANQTLKIAQAQYMQARALVRYYRAGYFPTVTAGLSATRTRISSNVAGALAGRTYNDFVLPFDVSYEADLWGRVRRTVEAGSENAQASAADLENVRLSLHAELALDYFQVETLDAEEQLLNSTVNSYEQALQLTLGRFRGGIASQVDVAQAQTQLETTRAQAIDIQAARAQFEHAIATLIGKPPAEFTLSPSPLQIPPPPVPVGLPSQLLERRPDIAAAERRTAAANANIGVARAAYYPTISLGASGGFESAAISTLLTGPGALWSVGGTALQTLFEGGRRRAISEQAQAGYDAAVASYKQTVLNAFQEVEDNIAALRVLESEASTQAQAVQAAQQSLHLSETRYTGGATSYLEVITAQSTALADERTAVQILGSRMSATVRLIEALGGGWDCSQLPSPHDLVAQAPLPTR
jgi:NodT family efflux transporter outer membrane factor (OMF) lipoprotein